MVLKIAEIMAQNRFTTGVKMGRYNFDHGALIKAIRYILMHLLSINNILNINKRQNN